jgi:hypothetical protein
MSNITAAIRACRSCAPPRIVEGFGGQAGAHDMDAIGCRLGGDLGRFAGEADGGIGDVEIKMLGHLVLIDYRADRKPISAVPRSGSRLRVMAAWRQW